MPEIVECAGCGNDFDQHGLGRHLEGEGKSLPFCSHLCFYFWRRTHGADDALAATVPSSSVH